MAWHSGGYLINMYENGLHKINHHSDDEPVLGENPTIVSVSFGATRTFELKRMTESQRKKQCEQKNWEFITNPHYKCQVIRMELRDGDVLIMNGPTQRFFTHAILPSDEKVGKRYNITFRPHYSSLSD